MSYQQSKDDLLAAIDQTFRANLIVSCEDGIDFINELISGISFNLSICSVIFYKKRDELGEKVSKLVTKITEWKEV